MVDPGLILNSSSAAVELQTRLEELETQVEDLRRRNKELQKKNEDLQMTDAIEKGKVIINQVPEQKTWNEEVSSNEVRPIRMSWRIFQISSFLSLVICSPLNICRTNSLLPFFLPHSDTQ